MKYFFKIWIRKFKSKKKKSFQPISNILKLFCLTFQNCDRSLTMEKIPSIPSLSGKAKAILSTVILSVAAADLSSSSSTSTDQAFFLPPPTKHFYRIKFLPVQSDLDNSIRKKQESSKVNFRQCWRWSEFLLLRFQNTWRKTYLDDTSAVKLTLKTYETLFFQIINGGKIVMSSRYYLHQ